MLLLVLSVLFLIALIFERIAERIRIPFSALLVVVGFVGSELIVAVGFDTGLRWQDFHGLVLELFVPILVFESAFSIHAKKLWNNIVPILLLAVPAMILAALVSALVLFVGIDHPLGFPLVSALITGVILSATDPVAVVALFNKLGAPERLHVLLEGESLFNDATAVVLFGLLVTVAAQPSIDLTGFQVLWDFLYKFFGAVVIGVIVGALTLMAMGLVKPLSQSFLLSLICAALGFLLAEKVFHTSGIVAVLMIGLMVGERCRNQESFEPMRCLFEPLALISNGFIFLLLGMTITLAMFSSHWLAMLMGIAAAALARSLNIYLLLPLSLKGLGLPSIPKGYRSVLTVGGLRGAVSIALALSLPLDVPGWYSIQSIVYGVVLFTLFVQAPTVEPLIRRLSKSNDQLRQI